MQYIVLLIGVIGSILFGAYQKSKNNSLLDSLKTNKDINKLDSDVNTIQNKLADEQADRTKIEEDTKTKVKETEKDNVTQLADFFNNHKSD